MAILIIDAHCMDDETEAQILKDYGVKILSRDKAPWEWEFQGPVDKLVEMVHAHWGLEDMQAWDLTIIPELDLITEDLLNEAAWDDVQDRAVKMLQDVAGITTGDVAAMAFSGGLDEATWREASHAERRAGLDQWLELERVYLRG